MGRAFSQQALCLGKLILHLLTGKKFYPVRVIVAQLPKKLLMGKIFTAKPHHQDGARIGMARQSRQKLSGLGVVMAGLAAAKRMRKGIKAVDAPLYQLLTVLCDLFCHIVYAAHRGEHPDLVADRRTAVPSPISHECLRFHRLGRWRSGSYRQAVSPSRLVAILWVCTQLPASTSSVAWPMGNPYLITCAPLRILSTAILWPWGISPADFHNPFPCLNLFSFRHRLKRHRHIIHCMDLNGFHRSHRQLRNAAFAPSVRIFFTPAVSRSSVFSSSTSL